jgi:DNA modification methylase
MPRKTSYSNQIPPLKILKEQFSLFPPRKKAVPSTDLQKEYQKKLNKRERLAVLLEGELNFHGENSSYASHDLHAFAAKFPPQLPRLFIRGLTSPGDTVLDPMMGSATTVVEAIIEGRKGIGLDIDPLALRIGKVKTLNIPINIVREAGYRVLSKANHLLTQEKRMERALSDVFDPKTKSFIDYWFWPITQRELMALILAIQEEPNPFCRGLLELTFSSIIVTKSGGVSRARDLAHSRPHLDPEKKPKNALEQFGIRLRKNLNSISQLKQKGGPPSIIASDAKKLPIVSETIDLIVTSPPYANAIDYMRAHKFSLVWLGESVDYLSQMRAGYIGSEGVGSHEPNHLPENTRAIAGQLYQCDKKKAAVLAKYFMEMKAVLSEMYRVLRKHAAAIIIVGPSVMRGVDVQTHSCLAEISEQIGFDVVKVAERTLDRNKRLMPSSFRKNTTSMIEQRIHKEFVIGLYKPKSH